MEQVARTQEVNKMRMPVRSIVLAPKDHLLVNMDLAQAESWIVAYLANEPTMKHVLAHGDIHRETAQRAFANLSDEDWEAFPSSEKKTRRYGGKQYNHATAYRMGPEQAARVINKKSDQPPYWTVTIAESKVLHKAWHDYYHIRGWWSELEFQLNKNRTLVTPYGRMMYFFDHWGDELFKKATAFIPQSTVADHLNGVVQDELGVIGGLLEVDRQFVVPGHIQIVNQSHDSILFEVHRDTCVEICSQIHNFLLRPIVINGEEFRIPVDCEIGERWGELEEQKRAMGSYDIEYSV